MQDQSQRRRLSGLMHNLRQVPGQPQNLEEWCAQAAARRRNETIAAEEAAIDARWIRFGLWLGVGVAAGLVLARFGPTWLHTLGVTLG